MLAGVIRGKERTFTTDDTETDDGAFDDDIAIAVDLGTGWVGNVIDVVLGDVEGIEIFGAVALGSRRTCFVVLISLGGIGCVGSCTSGGTDGDAGDIDTFDPCGCKVDAGRGCRILLTTAAADEGNADAGLIICAVCPVECIDVAEEICWGRNIVTPGGNGVS